MSELLLIERFEDEAGLNGALQLWPWYDQPGEIREEDDHHCVLRERWNEIIIAQALWVPVLLETTQERVLKVLLPDNSIIADEQAVRDFCRGKSALLRHYPYRTMSDILARLDTVLWKTPEQEERPFQYLWYTDIISPEEELRADMWPNFVDRRFLQRNIHPYQCSYTDLKSYFHDDGFDGPDGFIVPYPVFVKTQQKGTSHIVENKHDFGHLGVYGMHTEYFVGEAINIAEDEIGKREFRIYVVWGRAINAARMWQDYDDCETPEWLLDFAQSFATHHAPHFQSYGLDIAVLSDGSFAVVELNNIARAGRYFGNKFEPILRAFIKELNS